MRRSTIFRLTLIVFALGAFSFMGVFAQGGQTLVIGTTDTVGSGGLEPAEAFNFYANHLLYQKSQRLCAVEPGTGEIVGELAKSCQPEDVVSNDGLTYTFNLREGVTFTDGTELTAANVAFTFNRNLALGGTPTFLISGIKEVEVVDELTVRITLKSRDANFLQKIAGTNAAMILSFNSITKNAQGEDVPVNKETGELMGKPDLEATIQATSTNPQGVIGTGPYKLTQYVPGQLAVFETYENYWGCNRDPQFQCPKVDRVIERHFSTSSSLRASLQDGSIDVAWRSLNPTDVNDLRGSEGLKFFQPESASSVRYANFNVTNAPFNDLRVRKAISFAVDRQAIVDRVFSGVNSPIFTMPPSQFPGSTDVFPKRNLDRASQLLQDAGFTADNPAKVNLWFETSGHYGTTEPDVAAVLQESLNEVPELNVQLQPIDFPGLIEAATDKQTANFYLLGWFPDFVGTINFLNPWINSTSLGIFFDQLTNKGLSAMPEDARTRQLLEERGMEFNADNIVKLKNQLISTAQTTLDQEKRIDALKKLQHIEADTVPTIPLWSNLSRFIVATQDNIGGIVFDASLELRDWLITKQ
ncbi:MAG: ABC transporter substrate-binding protein [Candidatus Bipolaricaulia bacterium]